MWTSSTSASAELTRELMSTQEGKREEERHTDRLIRKGCSNAVLDEEACLNTCKFLRFVIVSGGKKERCRGWVGKRVACCCG